MANAFILRFQEPCAVADMVLSTATKTFVRREQPDKDPAISPYSAVASGTETVTKEANEQQRDADATADSKALPRTSVNMGTETITNVRAEASDTDPAQLVNRILNR